MTNTVLKETKSRIEEIKMELKEIATKLDEARKESNQDDSSTSTQELLDKKYYLEEQLAGLKEAIFKLTKKMKSSKKGILDIGKEATILINGSERKMTFVPPVKANPTKGLVSSESPIGQALLGNKAGQEVEIETPAGLRKFTILKVA